MTNNTQSTTSNVEEKLPLSMRLKIFVKKFRNYRLLSLSMAILGVLAVIAGVLSLTFFGIEEESVKNLQFNELENQFLGMFVFFVSLLLIVVGIVVTYYSYSFIFTREKKTITRTALISLAVTIGLLFFTIFTDLSYMLQFNNWVDANYTPVATAGFVTLFIFMALLGLVAVPFVVYGLKHFNLLYLPPRKEKVKPHKE